MKTIKSIIDKVEEMKRGKKEEKYPMYRVSKNGMKKLAGYDIGFNQALEQVKPIIEKEVRELLEGLIGEEMKKDRRPLKVEIPEDMYVDGFNQREQKLREDIERIII